MTDGPYPGSIRDDSNSGIRGLFAQLALIVAGLGSLPGLLTQVTQINTKLGRLVGATDSPSWPGLSAYLHQHFAQSDTPAFLNLPRMYQDVRTSTANLALIPGFLTAGVPTGTNTPYLATAVARLQSLLTAMELVRDDVDALALVNGTIASAPNGATLKSLLALIEASALRSADCCDGKTQNPPPDNSNPPPSAFCAGVATERVSSWQFLNQQVVGGVNANVYRPVFNFSPTALAPLTGFGGTRPAPSGPAIQLPAQANATFCVAWNFAGQFSPLTIGRYIGTDSNAAQDNIVTTNFLVGASTTTAGGESFDFNNCGGAASFLSFNAAFALGVIPPRSMFIGVSQNRGCAV